LFGCNVVVDGHAISIVGKIMKRIYFVAGVGRILPGALSYQSPEILGRV
jgi:hypothetical protein